jgi:hypothetical protein
MDKALHDATRSVAPDRCSFSLSIEGRLRRGVAPPGEEVPPDIGLPRDMTDVICTCVKDHGPASQLVRQVPGALQLRFLTKGVPEVPVVRADRLASWTLE